MSGHASLSLEELDIVALKSAVVCDAPLPLPVGSTGTIVAVLKHDVAFLVEFTTPFAALVEVDAHDLEAVPGESRYDLLAGRMAGRAS